MSREVYADTPCECGHRLDGHAYIGGPYATGDGFEPCASCHCGDYVPVFVSVRVPAADAGASPALSRSTENKGTA